MAEQAAKVNNNEVVKNILLPAVADIDNAPKGEMSLFAASKNLRIQVTNAKKVNNAIYTDFRHAALELKPAVAIFVSCQDVIPLNFETTPCLLIYVHVSDLNERLIGFIHSLPDLIETSKPKTKSAKSADNSFIMKYTESHEDFERYCREVPKTKIEFKKAVAKWAEEMNEFPTLAKFEEHIAQVKADIAAATTPPPPPEATIEEYHDYLKTTPPSKLRKTYIKENFGNLDNSITFLNETKDFLTKIREYQKKVKESK